MSRKLIRLEDWEAEKMKDPEFRAVYEALEASDKSSPPQNQWEA